MFVFDEESYDQFYSVFGDSNILGIQIEKISNDLYVHISCSNTSHSILSFSEEESHLTIDHLKNIFKDIIESQKLICMYDYKRSHTNLNFYNGLSEMFDDMKIFDIRYLINLTDNKLYNGIIVNESLRQEIIKPIYTFWNIFRSEIDIYNAYKNLFSSLFQDNYYILRMFLNNNAKFIDHYNSVHLKRGRVTSVIENNGLKLLCKSKFFEDCIPDELNYFKYSIYSTNGRLVSDPSNEVNILTIPNNQTRRDLVSKFENGIIFYFDYVSLHPRLLLQLINDKELQIEDDLYSQFQKIITTEMSRDDIKGFVYRLIYGRVSMSMFTDITIPNLIQEYSDKLLDEFVKKRMIVTPYNKEIILSKDNISHGILLSNYIQSIECDFVMNKINEINEYLKSNNYKTQVVLYFYDGIVIDYCKDDDLKIIKDIREMLQTGDDVVFERNIRFPVKMMYGRNFYDVKLFVEN